MIIDREEFVLDNFNGEIEIRTNKLELTIKGNVVLKEWIKENENLYLIINLEDASSLDYNRFGVIKNNNAKIVINQKNDTKLIYKESFIAKKELNLKIVNNVFGNNNVSEVIVRASSKELSNVLIDASLNVCEGTVDNDVKEDLKGLEFDSSKITIIPNMLVSSSEVLANHFVSIGNVREEDLFYLTSKGLTEENAKRLLESGFLISPFQENEFKIKIKEIIK